MYAGVAIGAAVLAGCPVFPADNQWNLRVDKLPVHPSSDTIVRSIGAGDHMHADFGSGHYQGAPIGIPYVTVKRAQRRVPVSLSRCGVWTSAGRSCSRASPSWWAKTSSSSAVIES